MIRSSILRSVELILGVLARDTVHGEADVLLIGAHSVIRPLAVDAVRRADIALVARVDQRLLQSLHRVAPAAPIQQAVARA